MWHSLVTEPVTFRYELQTPNVVKLGHVHLEAGLAQDNWGAAAPLITASIVED